MTDYFDALAERLRAQGVPAEDVRAAVDDLAAFAAESGADPRAEFGPVEEFAAGLTAGGSEDPEPPGPHGQDTWRWGADAFSAPRKLAEYGAQGWEVEDVDRYGSFLSRRDPDHPQQWEYRQEIAESHRGRAALAGRLAPEGWEPCGHWSVFIYLKRPKAASDGPSAQVSDPPPAPRRSFFLGPAGAVAVLVGVVALAFSLASLTTSTVETLGASANAADAAAELAETALGAVTGGGAVLLVLWASVLIVRRSRHRS